MKSDIKKQIKSLFRDLTCQINLTKESIKKEKHRAQPDQENINLQEEHLVTLKNLVKNKEIVRAFKILSSNNQHIISEYLEKEFSKFSDKVQKIIFHNTTNLSVDGKSVYENTSVNVWHMFKDPVEIDSHTQLTSIENLFKNKFMPKAIEDLFPIYTSLKENNSAYYVRPYQIFKDLIELSQITYKIEGDTSNTEGLYITTNCFKKLINTYFSQQVWDTPDRSSYTTERLQEFYSQLEDTVLQSPNLQKCNLLNNISIYHRFLSGENAYNNYLELIKHPEIKTQFYETTEDTGLNMFLRTLDNFPEKERLEKIAEYISDPQYKPTQRWSRLIGEYLQNYIKEKSLLIDFDLTMPIFEKIAYCNYPIAICFSKGAIQDHYLTALRQSEDEILGIDRANLNVKPITDTEKIEKFKTAILDYYNYGLIDSKTYEDVLKIGQKFNKNLTLEKLKDTISKNSNLKAVMEYLSSCSRRTFRVVQDSQYPEDCLSPYSRALYDFETIFPRTRLQSLPELEAFKKMSLDQKSKFNIKVWDQFASLPLFSKDDNTKKALVEFIAIMGLFEDDTNVEKRRQVAYRLATDIDEKFTLSEEPNFIEELRRAFYGNEDLPTELKDEPIITSQIISDFIQNKYLKSCKIKRHYVREGIIIPQELQGYFYSTQEIGEKYLAELKRMTGSFGKKMGNFLSPYVKDGDVYKLKKDVVIPESIAEFIKEEMPVEYYEEILKLANLDGMQRIQLAKSSDAKSLAQSVPLSMKISEIGDFLSPIREVYVKGVMPRDDLSNAEKATIQDIILSSTHLSKRLNFASIHRMFDGCKQEFNEDFYELIVKNWGLILDSDKRQSHVKDVQKSLQTAQRYYLERGNSNPTFLDIITYLDRVPFQFNFGLDEFAQEVKNSGVKTQETYEFYQQLLPRMKSRKKTTIPRHQKTYVYTDKNGKQYTILTKILRLDDPATMLVGESKFTNCCQVYHNAGQACMEHATTSQNGGIFATYLINDNGVPEMLTQSWIWTRESKLCLDNVEATDLITGKRGEEKRLYQDIATYGIVEAAKDLVENSRQSVEQYIAEQIAQINKSNSLTEEQKQQQLNALEELRQRQTLKIITVGEGCDDLNVAETFKKREKPELSQGPKKYSGYRDSNLLIDGKSKQHIVIQTSDEILPVDENYEDVAIYRDDRRISLKRGSNIPHSLLKHITEIERSAHKSKMVNYTDKEGPVLTDVAKLAQIYDCRIEDLRILAGEDWYYVYSDDGKNIEIYDFARIEPRLEDEGEKQQQEMNLAFNTILDQSIVIKNGQLVNLKGIKADLREDTSYLLYLYQKHRGLIEQAGDDLRYKYAESDNKQVILTQEQEETMRNMRQIRKTENESLYMHKVSFLATTKTIEKAIDRSLSKLDERSMEC